MKRTNELNENLAKIEDKFNLNSVSLTGDDPAEASKQSKLYTFEGQDYKKDGDKNPLSDFIDIGPRRERPTQNYNIDSYYKNALDIKDKKPTEPHIKKVVHGWRASNRGHDHQFFKGEVLDFLDEKEKVWLEYLKNADSFIEKPAEFTQAD